MILSVFFEIFPFMQNSSLAGWLLYDGAKKMYALLKGAVSRNSAKLGNYQMRVKLRET